MSCAGARGIKKARGVIKNKSLAINSQSLKYDPIIISRVTEMNWIKEYNIIYLKVWRLVTKAHFPSFKTSIIQDISGVLEVKGAAIEASSVDRDIPTSATFKALQSLAPSPHIKTVKDSFWRDCTICALFSGEQRA